MGKKLFYPVMAFALIVAFGCNSKPGSGGSGTNDSLLTPATVPYTVQLVEYINDSLPDLHSYTHAIYNDQIVMLGGRTNGLHGGSYNFSLAHSNTFIYVIDTKGWKTPDNWTVSSIDYTKLGGVPAGISMDQFQANNAEFFTENNTLYIVGGLLGSSVPTKLKNPKNPKSGIELVKGAKSLNGKAATTPVSLPYITAVNLSDLVTAVTNKTAMPANSIRQATDPQLAITGGEISVIAQTVYLVFGWDFHFAAQAGASGDYYSHQIRRFTYADNGTSLSVTFQSLCPSCWDGQVDTSNTGNFRRRDGSMSAMIDPANGTDALLYYAGVFKNGNTNFDSPVWIGKDTASTDSSFVMRSNVYTCQVIPVHSDSLKASYATMLGGMTNATFNGGTITQPTQMNATNAPLIPLDQTGNFASVPFSNQFTTISVNAQHQYMQYMLPDAFPPLSKEVKMKDTTLAAGSSPYNGAESEMLWSLNSKYMHDNGVIKFDTFIGDNPNGGVVGYLHGGILSAFPNLGVFTNTADGFSLASRRIFAVKIIPLSNPPLKK